MTGPENHGHLYWCVGLADGAEVYLHADDVEVKEGALIFSGSFYLNARDEMEMSAGYPDYREPAGDAYATLGFSQNAWRFFYAASIIDGSAVAVDHWPGQIIDENAPPESKNTVTKKKQGKDQAIRDRRYMGSGVRKTVLERDEYRCRHCGTHKDLSVDHIIPVSEGGTNDPDNLQTLCLKCNITKGAR